MGVYDIVEIDITCPYCGEFITLQTKSTKRYFRRLSPGDFVQSEKYYGVCGKRKPENFIIEAYGFCDCQDRYKGLNTWVDVYISVIGGIIQSEYKVVWKQDIDEGKRIIKLWDMYKRKLFEKKQDNKKTEYVMIPKDIYDKHINIFDEVIEKHKYKKQKKIDKNDFLPF